MTDGSAEQWVAFAGPRRIAVGLPAEVVRVAKEAADGAGGEPVLVFVETTGRVVELDLRGTVDEVASRYASGAGEGLTSAEDQGQPRRGPGRPKLGVVGREVTLLPRHWAWLSVQRGGASVTLRRLVDQARRLSVESDRVRGAQNSAYGFMLVVGGDLPGFEEATRALYATDGEAFAAHTEEWPEDLRDQARRMAAGAFDAMAADPPR